MQPVVECDKLKVSGDSYTASCTMTKSTGTNICKQHVEEHRYTGPSYSVKPLSRSDQPHHLSNLNKAPGIESGEGEIVEEQQYSSNITADAEIHTETDMGYEEWCAAQGLLNLKSDIPDNVDSDKTPSRMYKQLQHIHSHYLDVIFNFVQDNIVSEAEQGPLLRKLDAIAACARVKLILVESRSNDSEKVDNSESNEDGSNRDRSNGNGSKDNKIDNETKENDSSNCAKPNDIKEKEVVGEVGKENENNFIKEVGTKFVKGTEINTEVKETECRPRKSSLKTANAGDFVKDKAESSKQVSFAETVTPVSIQLQVDEIDDDDGNDMGIVIDEDIIEKKDVFML